MTTSDVEMKSDEEEARNVRERHREKERRKVDDRRWQVVNMRLGSTQKARARGGDETMMKVRTRSFFVHCTLYT